VLLSLVSVALLSLVGGCATGPTSRNGVTAPEAEVSEPEKTEEDAAPRASAAAKAPELDYEMLRAPLGPGRAIDMVHVRGGRSRLAEYRPGVALEARKPWPEVLSSERDAALKRAYRDFEAGNYQKVIDWIAVVFEEEKQNPFFLYLAGRAYYQFERSRNYSFLYLKWLEDILEKRGYRITAGRAPMRVMAATDDSVVIDAWFPDLYWYLALHYLERGRWQEALGYLARAVPVVPAQSRRFEAVLGRYAEAHLRLGNREQYRYFREATLRLYPENRYVRDLE
jgi:tetratricopeptide (TPR) repeat protein